MVGRSVVWAVGRWSGRSLKTSPLLLVVACSWFHLSVNAGWLHESRVESDRPACFQGADGGLRPDRHVDSEGVRRAPRRWPRGSPPLPGLGLVDDRCSPPSPVPFVHAELQSVRKEKHELDKRRRLLQDKIDVRLRCALPSGASSRNLRRVLPLCRRRSRQRSKSTTVPRASTASSTACA